MALAFGVRAFGGAEDCSLWPLKSGLWTVSHHGLVNAARFSPVVLAASFSPVCDRLKFVMKTLVSTVYNWPWPKDVR